MFIIGLIVGLFAGAIIGLLIVALCVTAHDADACIDAEIESQPNKEINEA